MHRWRATKREDSCDRSGFRVPLRVVDICSMSGRNELSAARLSLRRWRETDHAPFAALNADPMVMEYFPDRLTHAESDEEIARIEAGFATRGYGLWALEVRATGEFVGFTGLAVP